MPQWLSSLWSLDPKPSQVIWVCAAIFLVLLFVYFVYRVAFASRLRLPGAGRARQPRLGLVDAFSLDGQRQLVLVRRDNVEHLLMIGGPNDLLVESQIVRVAAPVATIARERDASAPKVAPVLPPPAEKPTVAVASVTPRPLRAAGPILEPASPKELEPVAEANAEPPTPRPVKPPHTEASAPVAEPPKVRAELPPLRAAPLVRVELPDAIQADSSAPSISKPPRPPSPAALSAAAAPPVAASIALARSPAPARPLTTPLARAPLPPPIGLPPSRPRGTTLPPPIEPPPAPARSPVRETKAMPPESSAPATEKPSAAPASPSTGKSNESLADLESLEAEMARLLGRQS